jgi:hypothetical protein
MRTQRNKNKNIKTTRNKTKKNGTTKIINGGGGAFSYMIEKARQKYSYLMRPKIRYPALSNNVKAQKPATPEPVKRESPKPATPEPVKRESPKPATPEPVKSESPKPATPELVKSESPKPRQPKTPKPQKTPTVVGISRSSRKNKNENKKPIFQITIGRPKGSYTITEKKTNERKPEFLISDIKSTERAAEIIKKNGGVYIIDFPVPPQRHTIIINYDIETNKTRVADWFTHEGDGYDTKIDEHGFVQKPKKRTWKWALQAILFKLLAGSDKTKIEYYGIDEVFHKNAIEKDESCSGGGCSNYAYEWISKYLQKHPQKDESTKIQDLPQDLQDLLNDDNVYADYTTEVIVNK